MYLLVPISPFIPLTIIAIIFIDIIAGESHHIIKRVVRPVARVEKFNCMVSCIWSRTHVEHFTDLSPVSNDCALQIKCHAFPCEYLEFFAESTRLTTTAYRPNRDSFIDSLDYHLLSLIQCSCSLP